MASLEEVEVQRMNAIMTETSGVMAGYVTPYLTPIFGIGGAQGEWETCELFGTGSFVQIGGVMYGVTAGHVLDDISRRGLTPMCAVKGEPEPISRPYIAGQHIADGDVDIGIFRISERLAACVPAFLNLETIVDYVSSRDILFTMGFPQKAFLFSEGVVVNPLGIATQEVPSSYEWFDPQRHVALGYPAQVEGLRDALPLANGLSGSLLWKTNRVPSEAPWSAEQARVVGVVVLWNPDERYLIAINGQLMRGFLKEGARTIEKLRGM